MVRELQKPALAVQFEGMCMATRLSIVAALRLTSYLSANGGSWLELERSRLRDGWLELTLMDLTEGPVDLVIGRLKKIVSLLRDEFGLDQHIR